MIDLVVETPTVQAGGLVHGIAQVTVDRPIDRVRVRLWSAVRGPFGHRDHIDVVHDQILHHAADSGTLRLPLALAVPCGPCSFDGKIVQVQWTVTIRVQGKGPDTLADQQITVLPASRPGPDQALTAVRSFERRRVWTHRARSTGAAALRGVVAATGAGLLAQAALGDHPVLVAVTGLAGSVGALGPPAWTLAQRAAHPRPAGQGGVPVGALGETLQVPIVLRGPRPDQPPSFSLRYEQWGAWEDLKPNRWGTKTRRTIWKMSQTQVSRGQAPGPVRDHMILEVPLPMQGPPSLVTRWRQIRWVLTVLAATEAGVGKVEIPVGVLPWVRS